MNYALKGWRLKEACSKNVEHDTINQVIYCIANSYIIDASDDTLIVDHPTKSFYFISLSKTFAQTFLHFSCRKIYVILNVLLSFWTKKDPIKLTPKCSFQKVICFSYLKFEFPLFDRIEFDKVFPKIPNTRWRRNIRVGTKILLE